MVPLHRFHEELSGRLIRRLVRAHQTFALPRQLRRCCPMDIDSKALAEAADARAIGSVDPHGTARRVGADLVCWFRVHRGFILAVWPSHLARSAHSALPCLDQIADAGRAGILCSACGVPISMDA